MKWNIILTFSEDQTITSSESYRTSHEILHDLTEIERNEGVLDNI